MKGVWGFCGEEANHGKGTRLSLVNKGYLVKLVRQL